MGIVLIHPLNARGALTPVLAEARAAVRLTAAQAAARLPLAALDITLCAEPGIDGGVSAQDMGPGVVALSLDPARFDADRLSAALLRALIARHRAEGGRRAGSLGERLVAAGLGGHAVADWLGAAPDPADRIAPSGEALRRAAAEWSRPDPDPSPWVRGGGGLRRGMAQALGFRLIAAHRDAQPDLDLAAMMGASADSFRASLRRLAADAGVADTDDDPTPSGPTAADKR